MARLRPHAEPLPPGRHPRARRALGRCGIALAVLVTILILAGQAIFFVDAVRSGALASSVSPSNVPIHGSIAHRLHVATAGALGPSDRGVRRFQLTTVRPDRSNPRLVDVDLTWAINNDLSAGTIGNEAQAEVYAVIRDIFTASLPVASLSLHGTYPVSGAGGTERETVVMELSIARPVALAAGQVGWDGMEPATLWPMLHRTYVAPGFTPLAPE